MICSCCCCCLCYFQFNFLGIGVGVVVVDGIDGDDGGDLKYLPTEHRKQKQVHRHVYKAVQKHKMCRFVYEYVYV